VWNLLNLGAANGFFFVRRSAASSARPCRINWRLRSRFGLISPVPSLPAKLPIISGTHAMSEIDRNLL
jgi:hypothetical protein